MAINIYINTDRAIERSVVANINQPSKEVDLKSIVAGTEPTVNLYAVKSNGTFDPLSGVDGVGVSFAINRSGARPTRGHYKITDGTDTTEQISYNASAHVVESALNALNSGTGPHGSLVDVTKDGTGRYGIIYRDVGARTVLTANSIDLYPESTVYVSNSIDGDGTTRAQQFIELGIQPAVYQNVWSTIANGFSATINASTTRFLQALEANHDYHLEIKLDGETVCKKQIKLIESAAPVGTFVAEQIFAEADANITAGVANAATSATNAATSATNAATSATNAANSAAEASAKSDEATNTLNDTNNRLTAVEAAQSAGRIGYQTVALLNADLNHAENTLAEVTNDPTNSNNGVYRKIGASGSGSWEQGSGTVSRSGVDQEFETDLVNFERSSINVESWFSDENMIKSVFIDSYGGWGISSPATDASLETLNGISTLKYDRTAQGAGSLSYSVRIRPGSVPIISWSGVLEAKSGGAGDVNIIQYDSSFSEITRTVKTFPTGAVTTPVRYEGTISLDSNCARVMYRIDCPASQRLNFSRPCIVPGKDSTFRIPRRLFEAAVVESETLLGFNYAENLFPNPENLSTNAVGNVNWTSGFYPAVKKNGHWCLETPSSGSPIEIYQDIPVEGLKNPLFSSSFVIHEKIGDQGPFSLRIRVAAKDSGGSIISNAFAGYIGKDFEDDTYYTKLLPVEDIKNSTPFEVCRGIKVPPATNTLSIGAIPTVGDTMTIGTKTYNFVANGTASTDGDIEIGSSLNEAKTNLYDAVMGLDGINAINSDVELLIFSGGASTVTAKAIGSAGDLVTTTETFTSSSNNFSSSTLQGGAHTISFRIRIDTTVQAYLSHFYLGEGVSPEYRQNHDRNNSAFVSPTGSDDNIGSAFSPFATISKALEHINGFGVIYMAPGDYFGTGLLSANRVQDVKIIAAEISNTGSSNVKTRIIGGTKLSGITNHLGKVYRANITLSGQQNHIWQHDVADTTTLIGANERFPQQLGRQYRLQSVKIKKVDDTSNLTNAVAEIESSSTPKCYYESGVIYFSIQGGGDATGEDIYVSSGNFFDSEAGGIQLETVGLQIMYMGFDSQGKLKNGIWKDMLVFGAPNDGFDTQGMNHFDSCEATGCGSGDVGGLGDGFNMHVFNRSVFVNCYSHSNNDDGFAEHENCDSSYINCLAEYNGGSAYIPTFGAHAVYNGCISNRNAQKTGTSKKGGWDVANAPTNQDDGITTDAVAIGCIAINEDYGFHNDPNGSLRTINCLAKDCVTFAFDNDFIANCHYTGAPATVKKSGATVENGSLVV